MKIKISIYFHNCIPQSSRALLPPTQASQLNRNIIMNATMRQSRNHHPSFEEDDFRKHDWKKHFKEVWEYILGIQSREINNG